MERYNARWEEMVKTDGEGWQASRLHRHTRTKTTRELRESEEEKKPVLTNNVRGRRIKEVPPDCKLYESMVKPLDIEKKGRNCGLWSDIYYITFFACKPINATAPPTRVKTDELS